VTAGLIIVALAAAWAFFCWRVRVEDGWVGITDYRRTILRFTGATVLIQRTYLEALTPAFEAVAREMRRWHDAYAAAMR
jgi:hypothetical protein